MGRKKDQKRGGSRRSKLMRGLIFVAILAFGFSATHIPPFDRLLTQESIEEGLSGMRESSTAWIPFTGLFVVVASLALPVTPLMLAAGYLFGFFWGMAYTWLASCLAAMSAYFVARWLGGDMLESLFRRSIVRFRNSGFRTVLYLRFIPVFPFAGVNFGAGAARVAFKAYFWATLLGMIPSSITFTFFASSFTQVWDNPSTENILVLSASILLAILTLYLPLRMRKKKSALYVSAPESVRVQGNPLEREDPSTNRA